MGSMVEATCSCGFSSMPLLVGGGMASYKEFNGVVAMCLECKAFGVANYMEEVPACAACGGSLAFYLAPSPTVKQPGKPREECMAWPDTEMLECLCPACGAMTMEFHFTGNWD